MKAITIWQPWASLLACGAKQYETRSWATSYRGDPSPFMRLSDQRVWSTSRATRPSRFADHMKISSFQAANFTGYVGESFKFQNEDIALSVMNPKHPVDFTRYEPKKNSV